MTLKSAFINKDSLLNILNNVKDVTNDGISYTLTFPWKLYYRVIKNIFVEKKETIFILKDGHDDNDTTWIDAITAKGWTISFNNPQ